MSRAPNTSTAGSTIPLTGLSAAVAAVAGTYWLHQQSSSSHVPSDHAVVQVPSAPTSLPLDQETSVSKPTNHAHTSQASDPAITTSQTYAIPATHIPTLIPIPLVSSTSTPATPTSAKCPFPSPTADDSFAGASEAAAALARQLQADDPAAYQGGAFLAALEALALAGGAQVQSAAATTPDATPASNGTVHNLDAPLLAAATSDTAAGFPDDAAMWDEWIQMLDGGDAFAPSVDAGYIPLSPAAALQPFAGQDTDDVLASASQFVEAGQYKQALAALESAVSSEPDAADAWTALGRVFAAMEEDDRAAIAFAHALRADPYHLDALLEAAVTEYNCGDRNAAARHAQSWLAHHPELHEVAVPDAASIPAQLARLRSELGEASPAAQAALHTLAGVAAAAAGELQSALACFGAAAQSMPDDAVSWNRVGACHALLGDHSAAQAAYARALQRAPQYPRARLNAGLSHRATEDWREALHCWVHVLAQVPGRLPHVWTYVRQALALIERVDLLEAAQACDVPAVAAGLGVPLPS